MSNLAEFSIGEQVSYWNGQTFFKATVHNLILHPIDDIVEYTLFYRAKNPNNGHFKIKAKPYDIKESVHFKGES